VTILLLAAILAILSAILFAALSSRTGIQMRVAGSNPEYARSIGIRVPLYVVASLVVSNALAGGAGALLAMYQGFADVSMGQGLLMIALASMTIGERLLPESRFVYPLYVILAAVLGSIVYQILVAYAVRRGLAPTDLRLVTAVFVLAVIAVRIWQRDEEFLDPLK
jgi:putative tryptophan/tyrosine transport system permease protein